MHGPGCHPADYLLFADSRGEVGVSVASKPRTGISPKTGLSEAGDRNEAVNRRDESCQKSSKPFDRKVLKACIHAVSELVPIFRASATETRVWESDLARRAIRPRAR